MSKIKVMQLLSPLTVAGAERVVLMLLRNIDRTRFDVSLCLFLNTGRRTNPFTEEISKLDIPTEFIYLDKIFRWNYVRQLRNLLAKHEVEILHSHSHRADITGYFANRRWGAKLVSTVHGWTSSTGKVRFYEALDRWVLGKFDRVIAVSDDVRRVLVRRGIQEDKIKTITNAIDFSAYSKGSGRAAFRERAGIGNGDIVIGTVGRLSREKALGDFLEMARILSDKREDLRFVIVGDGPEKSEILRLRDHLGLDGKVKILGYEPEVGAVYEGIDVFVLTSRSEGLPISLLESAYFQKPFVATAVGGIPEVFGEVGILVPPGDIDAMAGKILALLDHPAERDRYSKRLHDFVQRNCNANDWILKIQQVYTSQ